MTRRISSSLPSIALLLAACGGGGGGGGSTPAPPSPSPPSAPAPAPTLTFTTNSAMIIPGQSALLTWNSNGTSCTASGGWTGSKAATGTEVVGPIALTTVFSLSCTNNGSPATAQSVTVDVTTSNPPPAPTSSRVTSNLARTVLDYTRFDVAVNDIIWDSQRSLLYAVTRPDSAISPNSLISIDPATNTTQVRALGSEPWCVALSADGAYLYVGFRSGGTVRRFLTTGLAPDITITVGNADSWVGQVEVSPTNSHTFAARVTNLDATFRPETPGMVIADDAVLRPIVLHGVLASPLWFAGILNLYDINWNSDGTRIIASLGDGVAVVEFAVSAQGPALDRVRPLPIQSDMTIHGDKVFADTRVFSFTGPIDQLGGFAWGGGDLVYSESRGKAFSVGPHRTGNFLDGTTVITHDPEHYTRIDAIDFVGAAQLDLARMMIWGTDGIALYNDEQLFIAHGSFANAGGVPPPSPDALPVISNAVLAPGPTGLNYRVLDVGARDAVATTCGELYVSTAGWSTVRPNSVIQVNVANATIIRSGYAGSEPHTLAASDDCTTLYAGRELSNSVARMRAADLAITDEIPTGTSPGGLMRARMLSVAPGNAQTVAITHGDMDFSLCGGSIGTVDIVDGNTPRPVPYGNNSHIGVQTAVWGMNTGTIYGENSFHIFGFDVNSSGFGAEREIMPYRVGTHIYDIGRDLYFDPARNRLYNSFGNIYDAVAGVERGPLVPPDGAAIYNGCGTPGQTMTTDRTTGKIFWASTTSANQISVTAINPDTLAVIGRMVINTPGISEIPLRIVRPTSNSVAIVTSGYFLILVQGALLEP